MTTISRDKKKHPFRICESYMKRTIGVIGLGSIGMRHAKNLKAMGHHVWGCDPDMSKRLELGFDYTSNKPKHLHTANAIILALPTNQHVIELTEIPAHIPVFMEKPIGCCDGDFQFLSMPESLDLQKIKMVGYNLRFHGCVKKAKEWLDSDKIGKPLWANFTLGQHSEKPPYLRDGVILNWSHEIDLALYLLGDAMVTGSSTALRDGKDYMTDILLTHKGDHCRTTIHLDYISDPEIRQFHIHGSEGIIDVDLVRFTADLWCNEPTEPFRWEDHSWNDTCIEEMQAFLDRCDGKETIGCTGEEGLKVLRICLEVRKQAGLT